MFLPKPTKVKKQKPVATREEKLQAFGRLLDIMDDLRDKCPWDSKQTIDSLRYLTLEEAYELSDAILDKNMDEIREELGDLMMHLVFYAKIGEEKQAFDVRDVLEGISDKLVYRHPHIYSDVHVDNAEEVADNWEKLKLKEGKESVLSGVPKSLPPLLKAYRMQEKAKGVGFEWEKREQVWEKVEEEMNELKAEVEQNAPKEKVEDEFGDLLFALVNYARFLGINPDDALERTNRKFIRRFQYIETQSAKEGHNLTDMTLEEMDAYWNRAKKGEKG